MAKKITIVQVLVSSPSDLNQEREILEVLVHELNRTWSNSLGIMFELLCWENNVRPMAGSDPQSVINEQIVNDYDVFIGMLWGRFGSPTPRSESGTLEEFEHAMSRVRSNSAAKPEVMIYFKDAPISPSKIDPSQLQKVLDFRQSLSGRGLLYSTFEDEADFQSSLRAHLAFLAQSFAELKDRGLENDVIPRVEEEIDELGYFDYIEIYLSRMEEMTSTLGLLGNATKRIGEQMSGHTDDLRGLAESEKNNKEARRYIKRAADDLEVYATTIRRQLPALSESRNEGLNALTNALALYQDFKDADVEGLVTLRTSLAGTRDSASGSRKSLEGFCGTIELMPRLTSELNRAKKSVLSQLGYFLVDIDKTVSTIQNILDSIDRILKT